MYGSNIAMNVDPSNAVLLVIDMQESFKNAIPEFYDIARSIIFLERSLKELGVPIIGTEQVPEKLGETIDDVKSYYDIKFSKKFFDALKEDRIRKYLLDLGKKQILLSGIETHICVMQTALSALSHFDTYLVYDATGSAFREDKEVAISSLSREGVKIVTSEYVIYNMVGSSEHPSFRKIVQLVKEYREKRLR